MLRDPKVMGSSSPQASEDAAPGCTIGRFELVREIGRGSTSTVWEARDGAAGRVYALKLLSPEVFASPAARKRFVREAESARALDHPHSIVTLEQGETPKGGAYLVMEYLEGKTLAALLREAAPLGEKRAIHIVAQILDAIGAAHRLGIVHRDLKPGNVILVERDGDPDFVKVCDFGLAKSFDSEPGDTMSRGGLVLDLEAATTKEGVICGTPEYMAPEQARGEPIDGRADLYAIGVILYHAICGRLPFRGNSALAVLSQHLASAPPPPSELCPDLGVFPPLERLILRALAKDPAERPSSADVFRADLLQLERDLARRSRSGRPPAVLALKPAAQTLPSAAPSPSVGGSPRARPALVAAIVLAAGVTALVVRDALHAKNTPRPPDAGLDTRPAPSLPFVPLPSGPTSGSEPPTRASATPAPSAGLAPLAIASVSAPAFEQSKPVRRPSEADDPLQHAKQLLETGATAEACALGKKATTMHPESPAAWKFLGRCSMRLGDRTQGTAAYEKYLELRPNGPDAEFIRQMLHPSKP
jgi:serine/threonine-protein kinase